MKWEDGRQSDNVEDKRSAPRETDLLTGTIGLVALATDNIARNLGIGTDRYEMRDQLNDAQRDVDVAMLELQNGGADAAVLSQLRAQAQHLVKLQRALTDAGSAGLGDLKSSVAAAVATSATLVVQARDVAATAKGADSAGILATSAAARRQVEDLSRDIYERKIFDPYLKFGTAEEEEAYRRREAEAKAYIDAEMAKGTPEGDLNAAGAAQGQMLDAAAHGAADSPEFKERWEALEKTAREQREAVRAAGGSTEEYDKRLEQSVRRFLKSKGLSDKEIDERIAAAGDDTLQAVKPYLENERDALSLDKEVGDASRRATSDEAEPHFVNETKPIAKASEIDNVFAQFQQSGVQLSEGTGHGLSAGKGRDRDGPLIPT